MYIKLNYKFSLFSLENLEFSAHDLKLEFSPYGKILMNSP